MNSRIESGGRRAVVPAAIATAFALASVSALAITQSDERKNMERVGHTDLQGRPTYQPNVIQYPDGRWMLFVGQHGGVPQGRDTAGCTNGSLPNPLPDPVGHPA